MTCRNRRVSEHALKEDIVKRSKRLGIIFCVLYLASLLGTMTVTQYYTRNMPQTPQESMRRTVAVAVNYEKTVYVTLYEKRALYTIKGLNYLLLALFFLIIARDLNSVNKMGNRVP